VSGISLSGILYIYRARLRARNVLVQEGFAVLGIAVGVALLFASQVASTSLTRSVRELTNQIVGTTQQWQLDARGQNGFDESVLDEVRGLPGVRQALPVLEQQAVVSGPHGQRSVDLLGTDPRFAHLGGPLLKRFSAAQLSAQRAIALPAPIAKSIGAGPLETINVQIGASVTETLLGATLSEADIGGLVNSPVALAPVGYSQRLAGLQGRVSRIFVRTAPGQAQAVHARLARLAEARGINLEPADFDSRLFAVAVAPESQSEALFSAISALVGFMFAINAMLITVPSRRRLILQDIRPLGAGHLMTLQILLFDAAVVGVLGCLLGLSLGELISLAVFHDAPGYLSFAFPVGNDRIVTSQSVLLAVGAGLLAGFAGVLWPLRDVLMHPEQALKGVLHEPRAWLAARLTGGLLCFLITTVILLMFTQAAVLGNVTLVIALVCLLPPLFDVLVRAFDRVQRRFSGAASRIAVTELKAPQVRGRSLAIAATAAIAVFGIVEFQGTQANLTSGLDASARELDSGVDLWIAPGGESNAFATTPFPDTRSAALARLPGVASVGLYRGSFLDWGDRRLWILAPPNITRAPVPASQIVTGSRGLVTARVRAGGWAILSEAVAKEHHLHLGDVFTLPAPRPVSLRVAALITNLGWPPGAIIMNSGDYARGWMSRDPSAYVLQASPGVNPAALRSVVQRALLPQRGLVVETAAQRAQRHYSLARQGLSRLTQIRLLVLIAAVLAVAGAMGSMLWQRRSLVAFIKTEGYSKSVLWRWLLCESAVLLAAGCSIGAGFGLYAQLLGSHFLASVTGFPIVFNIEVLAAVSSFALVGVLALAIVAVPGYLVVLVPPSAASPAY
jgi:putative ABC transport system permease protein